MTPNLKTTTTDDLFSLLGLAVFEQHPDGLFQSLGSLPDWLPTLTSRSEQGLVDLADQFPLLEGFLRKCRKLWKSGGSGPIESGIWMDTDRLNKEVYLEAVGVGVADRRLIAIKSHPE